MTLQLVRCAIEAGVAVVTLDNPPLNVVTLELTRQLDGLVADLASDRQVRVMLLTGEGERAFCAGSDIAEFPDLMAPGTVVPRKLEPENETYSQVNNFPKPTIAALNGLAFGGGLELALCCDLIVAEAGGQVALPEIKLGIFPASGGTVRATRRVGEARAKQMMFFGDPVTAETALDWGLVDNVVAPGKALEVAIGLARVLADGPALALQKCKQLIDMSPDAPEAEVIRASLPLSDDVFTSADCAEGVRAFFAKETPRFERS